MSTSTDDDPRSSERDRPGEGLGEAVFCIVGLTKDLRARGLSRADIVEVLDEIDRRRRLYREDPTVVTPYRGD